MMSNEIQTRPNARNLPALPVREAERCGARILSALDRLGFEFTTKDGQQFGVCFSAAALWCDEVVTFSVDAERLYHYSVADLCTPKVMAQLRAVTGFPVYALTRPGLTYYVELKPAEKAKPLPARVELDLAARPVDGQGQALPLQVPVGVGEKGPVWKSVGEIGHAMIVGTSGAGKSTWLHAALGALVSGAGPEALRLVLVDLKRSELAPWANVPQVMGGIATTVGQATMALAELVAEVDRRGELLAGVGARDLAGYNKGVGSREKEGEERLPVILCVIDECLDLALAAGGRSELAGSLKTLAIRGRSAGVYLWAATQHAAAITGLPRVVNVNLTTRVVFRVLDRAAAEAAGCPGAERISRGRPGRMLARIEDGAVDLQGFVLSEEAMGEIAAAAASTARPGAGPVLSEFERELVVYAWRELGGAFTVGKLARAFGKGAGTIAQLACRWERRGWLTPQEGRNMPRRVTEKLLEVAGLVPA